MTQPIIHTMKDGFCTVCGDTAEWLKANGGVTMDATDSNKKMPVGTTVRIGKGHTEWTVKGYAADGQVWLNGRTGNGIGITNRYIDPARTTII